MPDAKFLLKKGRRWHINVVFPKRFKILSGKRVRISLETSDLNLARTRRDS